MNELCRTNCDVMTDLCAARAALAPVVTEAAVVADAAYALYDGARAAEVDAGRNAEVAIMEMNFTTDGVTDEDLDVGSALDVIEGANRAMGSHVDALFAREDALTDAVRSDAGLVTNTLGAVETNITTLDSVCAKGPRNGSCRAPRAYRNYGRQALGWAEQELAQRTQPDS